MTLSYDGRVAVITGAGIGVGRSHALDLARRGARVVVNDLGAAVDGTGAEASVAATVVAEIEAAGGEAVANTDSVSAPGGGEAIVQTALDAFGQVDVVINNAGILRDASFAKLTQEQLDAVLDVHLRGAFAVTQPAWRLMREQGYGRIVNTSSGSGLFGNFGQSNYAAAKMGLVGMTRVLAIEGAKHNIKVNAIAPVALTRMTEGLVPADADLRPELITPVVAYLAHEDCAVSGHVYSVGGGRVSRVFSGVTAGINSAELTAEMVAESMEQIDDVSDFTVR
jgi:NAD(P)-dependent dehydrogenase (short-subunit alcohol dehydrogenase family)